MRWEDEHWRKLYTRETAAWASLEWQAQACVLLFIKTCEADGTICAPRGPAQVARLWRWPADIIEAGLEQLEQDGTIARIGGRYHMPNFAAAQAARTSARQRKAQERERARTHQPADIEEGQSRDVDYKGVTPGHTASHGVTKERKIDRKTDRELTTAPARAPVMQRGAYRAAWHDVRLLLVELEKPLTRAVSWPVTEPAHFLEALRSMGGEKPLCEALRALQESIISGHIPADRWHRRMFSPGSVDGWLALLDEHRTREQARAALQDAEMRRIEQAAKPDTEPDYDDEAFAKIFEVVQ
jgi:hypothetical protein